MTAEQFEREKKYQAAVAVARSMLERGVIDEQDFLRVEEKCGKNSVRFWVDFYCENG